MLEVLENWDCWDIQLEEGRKLGRGQSHWLPPSMHRYLQGGAHGAVVILLMLGKLHQGKEKDEERHLTICICE